MATDANNIIQKVCNEFDVPKRFIIGPTQCAKHAIPRQEAYRRIYDTGKFTLAQIGKLFGDRHHTTIMYGIRKAGQNRKKKD